MGASPGSTTPNTEDPTNTMTPLGTNGGSGSKNRRKSKLKRIENKALDLIAPAVSWCLLKLLGPPGPRCPDCGAPEIQKAHPRTFYSCGSSDYDARPGTFDKGEGCR